MIANTLNENRGRASFVRFILLLPFVSLAAFAVATSGFAQVRSAYSPGSTLTGGGTVPDPGFSYSNQFWFNSSNELKGPRGNSIPIRASVTIMCDNNSIVYVPKFKFLRANLEFMIDIGVANGRFAARDPFSAGPGVSASGAGITNTNFVPFALGWHLKWADLQTGYSVYAPTGRFVPEALNNVSSGLWTNSWQAGVTLYLTESKNTQISLFNVYAWNTTQQATGVHPGQNESLDYSLSQTFSLSKDHKWSLQAGAAGYGQWQTTNNGGQNPIRERLRYGVNAGGLTINLSAPFQGLYVASSVLWEYDGKNTYQGRTMTFTAGFNF